MGAELGFEVEGMALVDLDGAPAADAGRRVSSTAIRRALAAGDLAAANEMLGRPHEVRGVVEHGDHRGRELGLPDRQRRRARHDASSRRRASTPSWYERPDGSVHPGAASLGRRPTFYEDQPYRLLEVHLLDVDDFDASTSTASAPRCASCERLRGEERFDTVDELVARSP